jgi:Zn-dependent metalloprotease
MRFYSTVSRLVIFTLVITLVLPFASMKASANNSESFVAPLDMQAMNNVSPLIPEKTSALLHSDEDVLNYLEETLINNTSSISQRAIAPYVNTSLKFNKKTQDQAGQDHYLYQKTINGVPVYGEYARIHLDSDRNVNSIQNDLTNDVNMNIRTTPSITADEAIHHVISDIEQETGQVIDLNATIGPMNTPAPQGTLMIYPHEEQYVLVYEIKLQYVKPTMGAWVAYVDAQTGNVMKRYSTVDHARELDTIQSVHGSGYGRNGDLKSPLYMYNDDDGDIGLTPSYYLLDLTKQFFGILEYNDNVIMTNDWISHQNQTYKSYSSPTMIYDADAVDAHYNSGLVFEYYREQHGWYGINNMGDMMYSIVHYEETPGVSFDNAFWNGLFMVYGDGSGGSNGFKCLACAKDIVAHEWTHGITQNTANLYNDFETGALNESISDIMAAVIDDDDWTIGEDSLSSGRVLRSLEAPNAASVLTPQPSHLNNYSHVPLSNDNGGVHTNSGIPNYAAYLMATNFDLMFDNPNNSSLSEFDGRAMLGELTFRILNNYLMPTSNFADARDSYLAAAQDYMNMVVWTDAQEAEFIQIISDAWAAVGVGALNINRLSVSVSPASGRQAIVKTASKEAYFFVPYGTNVTNITPTVTTSVYSSYSPTGPQNFVSPVTYTVSSGGQSQAWEIGAIVEPILNYSITGLNESSSNNGTIANTITVTLVNDTFTGSNGTNYITAGKVSVSNVPTGLTATVTKTSTNTVAISLHGSANGHANANSRNITVSFHDDAFTNFYDYQVTNATRTLFVHFEDPTIADNNQPNSQLPTTFIPPTFIPFNPSPSIPGAAKVEAPDIVVKETGPEFTPSSSDKKTETNKNGQSVVDVTLSSTAIDQLAEQLTANKSKQQLTINIEEDSDIVQLAIPAEGLMKLAASASNAVVVVKSGASSFQLPVGLLDPQKIAAQLKRTTTQLTIEVVMEKITGEVKTSFFNTASRTGTKLIGDAIDFSIHAEANGTSMEIKDFGNTYVSRTIMLDTEVSPNEASVVVFNPITNKLSFVPATFKIIDGKTEVTIKRNGNSIYAVVRTKKIFFDDVDKHWASEDIDYLAARSIISGLDTSTFKPNDPVTRAQFTTMLVQALGLSPDDTVSFSDIPANAWYKGNVGAAVKSGIASGIDRHHFKPDALITREQMAVLIANALTFLGKNFNENETTILLQPFSDRDQISSWARTSVAASIEAGIIRGMDKQSFAPLHNATRAQAAVMIRGLLTAVKFVN